MTTRAQLTSDLTSWLSRDDIGESPLFDSLLRNVEARIRRDVRAREQEVRLELSVSAQYTDLPEDYLRMRSITIDSELDREIDFYPPQALRKSPVWVNRSVLSTGQPQAYSIESNQLVLAPAPNADSPVDITLVYVSSLPPLSRGEDTNFVLREAYDLYLYGLLVEAAIFLEDQELLEQYKARYNESAASYNRSENRGRWNQAGLRGILTHRNIV